MQEKLREVTELQEVSSLKPLNEVSAKKLIEAKKLVLELIFKAAPSQPAPMYAALMRIYKEVLADVNDDELAYEIMRLVQRKGSKTDAVIELKTLNDGK